MKNMGEKIVVKTQKLIKTKNWFYQKQTASSNRVHSNNRCSERQTQLSIMSIANFLQYSILIRRNTVNRNTYSQTPQCRSREGHPEGVGRGGHTGLDNVR